MKAFFGNIWQNIWGRYGLTNEFDFEAVKARAIPVDGMFPGRLKFKWFGLYHYRHENLLVSRTRFLDIPYLIIIDLNTAWVVPKKSRIFLGAFYLFMFPFTMWVWLSTKVPTEDELYIFSATPILPPLHIQLFLFFFVFFMIQWQIQDEQSRATGAFRQYTTPKYELNRARNAQKLLIVVWAFWLFFEYLGLANWLARAAESIAGLF